MSALGKLSLGAVVFASWISAAAASDPRCSRPPYGGSPDRYRAILETYGQRLDSIAKTEKKKSREAQVAELESLFKQAS